METPEKSPTSDITATEWHASAEQNNEDLSTKTLTRGTQDINNGNVGRTQDPHTSLEALAKGNSTKCTKMTSVVLKSMPHGMQTEPQNSLQATPRRLPIEDEPCACEQEAAKSAMMAECMNGMAKMAKPTEMDADIDRTALLGGEPVEMACGVDKGDRMKRESKSRLQQMKLLCKEDDQRNASANVPSAYGVPLEGEWTVCSSGEASDYRKVESEGCEKGVADGDTGCGVEPVDVPNESETLVIVSIESEVVGSSDILRVCLGGMQMRTGNMNGSRGQMDWLECQVDVLRGWTDTPDASNNAETNVMDHGESVSTYLKVRDTKRVVVETDGIGSHADMPTRQMDTPRVETDANIAENTTENVRLPRKKDKPPNLPVEASRGHPDEPDGCGNHADALSAHMDSHCIGNETETAANGTGNVRTSQNGSKTQDSPYALKNELIKRAK